jgi:OmpA-OmpF porin, OOP family
MSLFTRISIKASLLTAAISLLSPSLNAQEVDNRASVYAGVVNYIFNDKRFQDDDFGFAIGGEVPISERWAIGLEYWDVDSGIKNSSAESNLQYSRLAANYNLDLINNWQPYLSFAIGDYSLDRKTILPTSSHQTTFDAGIGVKRYLNDNFFIKGDAKTILGRNNINFDVALSLTVGYAFGSRPERSMSMPVAASTSALDSDADGVMDNVDSCRNTPSGAEVDSRGCERDSDRDGVVDSRDNCPQTATDLAVDVNGCPILETSMMHQTLEVQFDTDRSVVKPEYDNEISDFADFMNMYGNTEAVIEGHTDSAGAADYNQGLSERRADAVRDELVNEYGVSASRLSTVGFGERDPVAPNTTAAGRASNRRIDAELSVEVEQEQKR